MQVHGGKSPSVQKDAAGLSPTKAIDPAPTVATHHVTERLCVKKAKKENKASKEQTAVAGKGTSQKVERIGQDDLKMEPLKESRKNKKNKKKSR